MTLKAAYFTLTGLAETAPITWRGQIQPAIEHGRGVRQINWPRPGEGHNVRAWAEFLVAERAATPGSAYSPTFGREVQVCGQRIGQLWSETLRCHKNQAYSHELLQVHRAAE